MADNKYKLQQKKKLNLSNVAKGSATGNKNVTG